MAKSVRVKRIAERIREELSELLVFEITDPRLTGVSVTDVTVDRELAFAKVYVSAIEGEVRKKEVLDGLKHAAGFLRFTLSQRIDLRSFPQLRFYWDVTAERAERIEELFATLTKETKETKETEKAEDQKEQELDE